MRKPLILSRIQIQQVPGSLFSRFGKPLFPTWKIVAEHKNRASSGIGIDTYIRMDYWF